ncbi:hypothetical protein CJ030_MR3G001110 [Morella rubra]|uniref:Uncharacterized protein n=1 Tax=Morella rubra TaxID=262757 RepID=A0A6A1W5M6_9ROSI|nr:hypothetical protein CJ030_MR3G001110 [Morella rubra]
MIGQWDLSRTTTSSVQGQCLAMPTKDANGVDTYNNTNYSAPVHAISGMAGFSLDNFTNFVDSITINVDVPPERGKGEKG